MSTTSETAGKALNIVYVADIIDGENRAVSFPRGA